MMRTRAALATLALAAALGACAADAGDDESTTCSASEPIECRSPESKLVGCCPESHPVCAIDGKQCFE